MIGETLDMGYKLGEIWMVSLGPGRPVHDLSQADRDKIGEASRCWGILGWIGNRLLDHMMSASPSVSAHQCSLLLGERYLRINGELPRKLLQLDNTDPVRLEDLKSYAFLWYEEHAPAFRTLIRRFKEARSEHQASTGSKAVARS